MLFSINFFLCYSAYGDITCVKNLIMRVFLAISLIRNENGILRVHCNSNISLELQPDSTWRKYSFDEEYQAKQ